MKIEVLRYSSGKRDTLGLLFIDCQFYCYTLEDEFRTIKKHAETRIPEGTYELRLRSEGGFHNRYLKKFGSEFHKGMLELQDVPNFTYVLIHIGNDEDDTAGCLLIADTVNNNTIEGKKGFIGGSTGCYQRVYPIIRDELLSCRKVFITIKSL